MSTLYAMRDKQSRLFIGTVETTGDADDEPAWRADGLTADLQMAHIIDREASAAWLEAGVELVPIQLFEMDQQ